MVSNGMSLVNSKPVITMRATQKEDIVPCFHHRRRVETGQIVGLIGPAERAKRPQRAGKPRVEHVGVLFSVTSGRIAREAGHTPSDSLFARTCCALSPSRTTPECDGPTTVGG